MVLMRADYCDNSGLIQVIGFKAVHHFFCFSVKMSVYWTFLIELYSEKGDNMSHRPLCLNNSHAVLLSGTHFLLETQLLSPSNFDCDKTKKQTNARVHLSPLPRQTHKLCILWLRLKVISREALTVGPKTISGFCLMGGEKKVHENWLLRWDFILLFKNQLTPESLVAFCRQTARR